jgi:CheY-like chemotaxis protein
MNKRILLADDSPTIQKVVELTFMDESFEVEAVGSGDDAISSLERDLPALVIADVHMPGASGYEVCRRAKQLDPNLPVLLLVGTFEALDEDEIVACGANGNLKKPFDSQELLQMVKEMAELAASAPAAAPAAVEGFEPTGHEVEADEPATPATTGFETTVFDMQPQPDEEPEFVPSAGFDFGRDAESDATPEPTTSTFEPADPMDELLGALDATGSRAPSAPAETPPITEVAPRVEAEAEPAPPDTPAAERDREAAAAAGGGALSDSDVDRVARRVVEMLSEQAVREVAWEVIPDLAEIVIKDRIRELEAEAE